MLPSTLATFNTLVMMGNYFELPFVLLGIKFNIVSALHNFKRKFRKNSLLLVLPNPNYFIVKKVV